RTPWPRRCSVVAMGGAKGDATPAVLHAHGWGPRAWRLVRMTLAARPPTQQRAPARGSGTAISGGDDAPKLLAQAVSCCRPIAAPVGSLGSVPAALPTWRCQTRKSPPSTAPLLS